MYKTFAKIGLATSLSLAVAMPSLAFSPKTEDEKTGYSLGVMLGRQLHNDVKQLNLEGFNAGFADVYAGADLKLNDEQIGELLESLQQKLMAEAHAAHEKMAQDNLEQGEKFLAANAKKSGVKTTKSGLQYKQIKAGKGSKPSAEAEVKVHYEGKLINGEVFDSSYQRGEPVNFKVNQVIAGWQEGLQLMQPGSEWELYIPANLAYGQAGAGEMIGPNSTLVFKVELLEVK